MTITRDSILWGFSIAGSLIAYLIADGRSFDLWVYNDWLKFAAAVIATVAGKLASSPLKHSNPYKNLL